MAADFPDKIFLRPPVLDDITDIDPDQINELYDEVEAIEQYLGYGSGDGTPSGGLSTLADRLNVILADSGRQKRKVSAFYLHNTFNANYHDLKGEILKYVCVGYTGVLTGAGPHTITYMSTASYGAAPSTILTQVVRSGATTNALKAAVIADSVGVTNFQIYAQEQQSGVIANPSVTFNVFWVACGGF